MSAEYFLALGGREVAFALSTVYHRSSEVPDGQVWNVRDRKTNKDTGDNNPKKYP